MIKVFKIKLGIVILTASSVFAQAPQGYQVPPKPLAELATASINPSVRISSNGKSMLLLDVPALPEISELSQPELRLAGLRLNPAINGQSRSTRYTGISYKSILDGTESKFKGLPAVPALGDISWSPDETMIAFTHTTELGVELWIADLRSMEARKLHDEPLNDTYGRTFIWTPDGKTILAKFVDKKRKAIPVRSNVPSGPVIQQNTGDAAPVPTYQDLLKNPHDEMLFEYYLTAQLKLVALDGKSTDFGKAGIYRSFDYSPDGNYILATTIQKPYSYVVTLSRFPLTTTVYDNKWKVIKTLHEAPLAENLPSGFDAVPTGKRNFAWRSDKGAEIYWVEALDNGNPNQQATIRDVVYTQSAPFNINPVKLADCYLRFSSITWGDEKLAILTERWWKTRAERMVFIKPGDATFRVNLFDRYYEDSYSDPGNFVTVKNGYGRSVLLTDAGGIRRLTDPDNVNLFSIGVGASPEGDRPFVMKFNIKTKVVDTLFKSRAPFYERPIFFNNETYMVLSRESQDSVPNYFRFDTTTKSLSAITDFKNPYPALDGITKQKLNYKRLDGIELGATLYLPRDFKKGDDPLPVLIWAYPREFKTVAAAGQVSGSPYRFTTVSSGSPIYWVTRGYAILDNADMPVVGESNKNPNDTFVEQIRYNAEAAINHLVELGVADPKRIAVGGHSYGAFMTANLLAHTRLFAAGIARSGAYNRSLTPFGFQAEERSYWQAPELYSRMSPFTYAHQIKTPLLLIHGEADNNTGTFPMQSERMYSALKGHGATARLVLLPAESHSYQAKQSVLHMLWEMDQWLEKYVKNKK